MINIYDGNTVGTEDRIDGNAIPNVIDGNNEREVR